jgi:hypothetical protein
MKSTLFTTPLAVAVGVFAIAGLNPVVADDATAAPTIPADYTGKPETGSPQMIPGKIKAVDYDTAPNAAPDITYHYGGKATQSKIRKEPDSLGLATFDKSHLTTKGDPEDVSQVYVGWTQPHEWLKYTVTVAETGTYVIGAHVAAGAKGATLTFSFGDNLTTGEIEIPTTAGFIPNHEVYHVWETLDNLKEITLPAGTYVMKVEIGKTAGMNLESFTFTKKA